MLTSTNTQPLITSDYLGFIGAGRMSGSAYDTAWVARLGDLAPDLSQPALEWLRANQLNDGTWGTPEFEYHHERLICTLAAMNALARHGHNGDSKRVKRARMSLDRLIRGLKSDPAGETIGFELIVPTLLDEAKELGIVRGNFSSILYKLAARRTVKLSKLPEGMINRYFTVAFSSEMVGLDALPLLDVDNLQEGNGSVAFSPAATAFFAVNVKRGDATALQYLHSAIDSDGSAPNNTPIDVFEIAWGLWNMLLTGDVDPRLCAQSLDLLEAHWSPTKGIGACGGFSLVDSDDTAIVYEVLKRMGRSPELEALMGYETDGHFRCFPLESDPSVSANIHVLSALQMAGLPADHPAVMKILLFLASKRVEDTYWFDKWHVSPYYTTGHAVIAMLGTKSPMIVPAVEWLLSTQRANGSWGYYLPTAEETAYALQALVLARRAGHRVPDKTLTQGAAWLQDHREPPYPMLWIGKSLYTPPEVIRGAVLSALTLVEQEGLHERD